MKRIEVAVGLLVRPDRQVLISLRQQHQHLGGLWEFPGGKREAGESFLETLKREIHEELAVIIHVAEPFLLLEHDYSDKQVCLDVWLVSEFSGEPVGNEGQTICWKAIDELDTAVFPEANKAIIDALQQKVLSI